MLQECGCIREYGISSHNGALDRQHIDAWFIALDGELVLFQIKSSERGVEKHVGKYPEIPCLNLGVCKLPADAALLIQETFHLPPLYQYSA